MSHLSYHNYAGYGDKGKKEYHYSQAVRRGNVIECSGQGGIHPTDPAHPLPASLSDEIAQAFSNVDLAIKTAGGSKGWGHVYKVRSYHVGLQKYPEETIGYLVEGLRKWCPEHEPLLTVVGVESLALEGMRVELEVVAEVEC